MPKNRSKKGENKGVKMDKKSGKKVVNNDKSW